MAIDFTRLLAAASIGVLLLLALMAVGSDRAYAGCNTLSVDGKVFVFNKGGLTCKKAKDLARQTYRTNKPPRGWRCPDASPGNNRRDGANCFKPGTEKFYGYHAFD